MAIWTIIRRLWNITNHRVRNSVRIMVLWPVLMALCLVYLERIDPKGERDLKLFFMPLIALVPVGCFLSSLAMWRDPLVIAIVGSVEGGRKILRLFMTLVGIELALGLIFTFFPFGRDPVLLAPFLLSFATLVFLAVGNHGGWTALLRTGAGIAVIAFLILLLVGGRPGFSQKLEEAKEWATEKNEVIVSTISSRTDDAIHLTLTSNEWSMWIRPDPGQTPTSTWTTLDGLISTHFHFDNGQEREYAFDIKERIECAPTKEKQKREFPIGTPYQFRFKHEKGGTVTITFR